MKNYIRNGRKNSMSSGVFCNYIYHFSCVISYLYEDGICHKRKHGKKENVMGLGSRKSTFDRSCAFIYISHKSEDIINEPEIFFDVNIKWEPFKY